MAKARVNSGFGRNPESKTSSPTKPSGRTRVNTGFRALEGLNSTGRPGSIPHHAAATPTAHAYGAIGKRRMF